MKSIACSRSEEFTLRSKTSPTVQKRLQISTEQPWNRCLICLCVSYFRTKENAANLTSFHRAIECLSLQSHILVWKTHIYLTPDISAKTD